MLSDTGCHRPHNEDHASYADPQPPRPEAGRGVLALVADGMGGHAAGEVASEMAVRLIERVYYRSATEPHQALENAFLQANRRIYYTAQRTPHYQGMGTTCTSLVLRGGYAYTAHVGDSRLYLVRGGTIYLMTEDHSVAMQMVRQGLINSNQARHRTDKNVILRALGTKPQVAVSTWEQPFPVRVDDRFILCTDGLSDLVHDDEIKTIVIAEEPATACEMLIRLVKNRGGYDNITVGVLHVQEAVDKALPETVSSLPAHSPHTKDVSKECDR